MNKAFIYIAIGFCGTLAAFQIRADNIVTNPGFETGDLSGWNLSGAHSSPSDNGIYYGVDPMDAHSGANGAYFGPVGGILNLSQALATSPGTTYSVTFWLAHSPETPAPYINSVQVSFGSTTLLNQTQAPVSDYTEYSYTAVAGSSATNLLFAFRDDTSFFSLDDISVSAGGPTPVPEPASILLVSSVFMGFVLALRRAGRNAWLRRYSV
jgi:hypothetical protein